MGWTSCYKKYGQGTKSCVLEYCFGTKERENVEYIEVKKGVAFMIYNDNGIKHGLVYLLRNSGDEFCYKDMDITSGPYAFNCSEKFYKMCKEIYSNRTMKGYADNWFEGVEKEMAEKQKIKNLKVGDIVEFEYANYANQKQWKVTSIKGQTVLFEGYKLKGWRNQKFKVIDKFTEDRYIGA